MIDLGSVGFCTAVHHSAFLELLSVFFLYSEHFSDVLDILVASAEIWVVHIDDICLNHLSLSELGGKVDCGGNELPEVY